MVLVSILCICLSHIYCVYVSHTYMCMSLTHKCVCLSHIHVYMSLTHKCVCLSHIHVYMSLTHTCVCLSHIHVYMSHIWVSHRFIHLLYSGIIMYNVLEYLPGLFCWYCFYGCYPWMLISIRTACNQYLLVYVRAPFTPEPWLGFPIIG